MEKANVLLHQIQEIKSHQKQMQPKKKPSAPPQQQQYPQQPYGQQQLPPIPSTQQSLPPPPQEQQQWGRQQPPPPQQRPSGPEAVAGDFMDLRLTDPREREYQQQQQQQQLQQRPPRPGSAGPGPQPPGYPPSAAAGRVPPPSGAGYPDRSGSPYRGTSMDITPDGVPNAVCLYSSITFEIVKLNSGKLI